MKKRLCQMLALLVLGLSVSGCYGPFNLTKKVHKWNGGVGDKWINEAVFLGMVIIPVYEIATLADALVLNSIQFWTGNNPVTAKALRSKEAPDRETVLSYRPEARRLHVYNFDKGRPVSDVVLEPGEGGMVARSKAGELLFTSKTEAGQVVVRDGRGKELGRYDPAEIQGKL